MIRTVYGEHFCGNRISDYGIEHGYLDYATFAKAFDSILNNDIINATSEIGYWDMLQGVYNYEDEIEELKEDLLVLEIYFDNVFKNWQAAEDLDYNPETINLWEEEYNRVEEEVQAMQEQIDDLEYKTGEYPEVFQTYIVSDEGARLIQEYTSDPLYYNDWLDMYVWGVTHWGTNWSYVLTDVRCNTGKF